MSLADLKPVIEAAFDNRDAVNFETKGEVREAVDEALIALDSGKARVAEKFKDEWVVHQWLKKAVLLSFRLNDMALIAGGPGTDTNWWDKVPSKFDGWGEASSARRVSRRARRRCAPLGLYRARVVMMPSFVNLGAYVDEGTMVDTWVTVGSVRRSARIVTCRAASALAACWSRCRPIRSSSRIIASSARARKWWKG